MRGGFHGQHGRRQKEGIQKGAGPLQQGSREKRRDDVSILCCRLSGRRLAGFCPQISRATVTEASRAPSRHGIRYRNLAAKARAARNRCVAAGAAFFSSNGKSLSHAVAPWLS